MELHELLESEAQRLFKKPMNEVTEKEKAIVYKYTLDTLNRKNEEIISTIKKFTEMVEISKDETKLLRSTNNYKALFRIITN